jgi:tetratricopeptide (TPR) repeat protein
MLVHLRRASIFEKSGAFPDAVKEYIQIFNLDETSWQAGIAASRTREIAAARSISLTEESRLALARALYSAARYSDALEMLKKLVQETGDKKVNRKGLEYLVKSCVRAGKIAEADRYIKQYADAAAPPYEWIKLKADEQWEGGRRGQAVAAYSMVREGAPEPLLRESRKRVALFMEERRAAGFEKILHEYRSSYPDDPASEYFTWALGKEALRRNDSTMAVSLFEEGLKKFPRGEYSDRCRFWLCKLYSSGGRKADGDAKFREMVVLNPESSYTWRLIEQRTGEHNPGDLKKSFADALAARDASGALFAHTMLFIQEKDVDKRDERIARMASHMREPYAALPRLLSESGLRSTYKSNLTKLKKYFVIGHLDGILKELGSLPSGQEIQKDKNIALSLYGEKYGLHYYMLLSTLEILREGGIPENVAMLPREALKRLLPMPFEACTVESASEFKVDVAAIYAVIKAESLFNHRAVSPAGAVGLMQLMPGTARGIARTIKVRPYDLKDPCTSVRFGAHYIAWLKKLYRGDFDYMIAGYNAGAGNVNRWRNERKADRDYFMEFIPFDETRYYVLRTGKFLYQYRLMHAAGH